MHLLRIAPFACAALVAACSSSSNNNAGTDSGTPATFTQVYSNVIATKCTPCHTTSGGQGVQFGMLDMTSKDAAYMNLVNVMGAGDKCAGKGVRVVPGMADSSLLYLKTNLTDPAPCGVKMPLGGPALAQSDVDMIESWIANGAKND